MLLQQAHSFVAWPLSLVLKECMGLMRVILRGRRSVTLTKVTSTLTRDVHPRPLDSGGTHHLSLHF